MDFDSRVESTRSKVAQLFGGETFGHVNQRISTGRLSLSLL